MTKVTVKPGICGLISRITVTKEKDSDYKVKIKIESASDNIKRLAEQLTEADARKEVLTNFSKSGIYQLGSDIGLHVACPVPSAIIKAIEVETGFALPKDVEMKIEKV